MICGAFPEDAGEVPRAETGGWSGAPPDVSVVVVELHAAVMAITAMTMPAFVTPDLECSSMLETMEFR